MKLRFVGACVMALVSWAIVPGIGELLENAVHFTVEGHLAHSAPDGDTHGPALPEHGCSGTYHLCSCCHTTAFALGAASAVRKAPQIGQLLESKSSSVCHDLFARRLDHPPRA